MSGSPAWSSPSSSDVCSLGPGPRESTRSRGHRSRIHARGDLRRRKSRQRELGPGSRRKQTTQILETFGTVDFRNQRAGLVGGSADPPERHVDAQFLGGRDALPQIFIPRQKECGHDGSLTGQDAQVAVDQGVDALLTAAAQPAEPKLDVWKGANGLLLDRRYTVDSAVVPIDAQQREIAGGASPLAQPANELGVVDRDIATPGLWGDV